MKGICKRLLALAAALLLCGTPALAADMSIQADKTQVQAGDTVEVTITIAGKGMALAEGTIAYDPAVLAFLEGHGGASDGFLALASAQKGGSDTLTARILFTAAAPGSVRIEATLERVLGYDGKEQEGAKASVALEVTKVAVTPSPTPISDAAQGVPAQNVKGAQGELFIWRSLENVTLPSRYSQVSLDYHGETVAAAQVEDSDAPTLLYLTNAAGDQGGYYIYNQQEDTLYAYQTITSISKSYIILEPDGSVALPDGFTQTTLTIDEKEYPAWKAQNAQGEVYLLYARNPDGETGYYGYNVQDASLQRYAVMPARPVQPTLPAQTPDTAVVEPAPEQEQAGRIAVSSGLFYALCGAAGVLLVATVGLLILRSAEKKRRRRRAAQRRAKRQATQPPVQP